MVKTEIIHSMRGIYKIYWVDDYRICANWKGIHRVLTTIINMHVTVQWGRGKPTLVTDNHMWKYVCSTHTKIQ